MDVKLLLECFSATLKTDQNIRIQAESKLRELAITPGFLGGCLDIISSEGGSIDSGIKQAAAVYFKNRIIKHWSYDNPHKVDNDERPVVKDRILQAIVHSQYNTKQQLIPVLRTIVSYDFPDIWPTLLGETGNLLQQVPQGQVKDSDFSQLYTGLLCFAEIARKFRWINNEDRCKELDPMIVQVFPHLLNIGNSIIGNGDCITEFTCEILKLILKVYKFVTYFDLPVVLQSRESLVSWGQFHVSIINMSTPSYILNSHANEQEKSMLQFSKCCKWSIANIYRLFNRYGSLSLSKKYQYTEFHTIFIGEFIPHLVPNYLSIIEQWCSGKKWLSTTSLYYFLQFLSHCVSQKATWGLIKPYFETLVSHFIYPLLCPSDRLLETFENDPQEYIHVNFDIYDEFDSPDIGALGLLVTLVDKRKKTTLEPIMSFIYSQLTQLQSQEETVEVSKKKEGALRLLGGISHYLTNPKSAYYSQMEAFLINLVFPSVTSKFDFLKARSLEVASKFSDLNYTNFEALSVLFSGILTNFDTSDSNLPVCLQAALAIQAFLPIPQFKEMLSTIILPTMSKLLQLSNEIDNELISVVMQDCVENFSEQLQPFGADLMCQLVEQFMRLAAEINEASKLDIDDFDGEIDDQGDKVMAATGFLNTMITVLLSFENSRETCIQLESAFVPAIEYVLTNKLDEFLTEIGELMENSTFLLRAISPNMWKCFDLLCESFNDGIALMYVEELIQCIQNFLIYGYEDLIKNPNTVKNMYEIFKVIVSGDDNQIGYDDMVYACDLAQTFVLSLREISVPYIPNILEIVLKLSSETNKDKAHIKNNAFNISVNNTILSCLVQSTNQTLVILQNFHELEPFFNRWFNSIPQLKRVFDLKLSTLGLMSLISNNDALSSLDESITGNIGQSLAYIFLTLPKCIKDLETKRKNFSDVDFNSSEFNQDWGNFEEEVVESEELSTEPQEYNHEYLEFLQQENSKLRDAGFFDQEDEDVMEDPLANTPLDGIDIIKVFKEFLEGLHINEAEKYQAIFGRLIDSGQFPLESLNAN